MELDSYSQTVQARGAREGGRMYGQPIKTLARVLILFSLLGGAAAVYQGRP